MAAPWIHRVGKATVDFEKLAGSEGFVSLDAKLAAGLLQMAKGALGRKFQVLADQAAAADTFLRGRQLSFVKNAHCKIDEAAGMVYNIQSLVSVKFLGDSKLEQFISNWDTVSVK